MIILFIMYMYYFLLWLLIFLINCLCCASHNKCWDYFRVPKTYVTSQWVSGTFSKSGGYLSLLNFILIRLCRYGLCCSDFFIMLNYISLFNLPLDIIQKKNNLNYFREVWKYIRERRLFERLPWRVVKLIKLRSVFTHDIFTCAILLDGWVKDVVVVDRHLEIR